MYMKNWIKFSCNHFALALLAGSGLALVSGCCSRTRGQASYWSSPGPAYASTGSTRSQQYAQPTAQYQPTQTDTNNMVIPLYEESLNVGKREVEAGAVHLRKIVRTETVNQPVELRHEEVVIDREPPGAQTSASQPSQELSQQFQEGETVIRLQREVPVVEKQIQPAGRIVVQTRMSGDQTNVQSQIRREDIDIIKEGNPQNVIIGENVRVSARTATGAAGEVGGQNSGAAANSQDQDTPPPRPEDKQ